MNKKKTYIGIVSLLVICGGIYIFSGRERAYEIRDWREIASRADIRPDCSDAVIPPDIAPLNFAINEDADVYCLKISSDKGGGIDVFSQTSDIIIPQKKWSKLLKQNKGGRLKYDIYTLKDDNWQRYESFVVHVAKENIDSHLVYRKMHPGFRKMSDMGIYQRDLSSYKETPILEHSYLSNGCVNCHTFCNNDPDKMLLGIRSSHYGTNEIVSIDGKVSKIGTKFGYTTWHTSGKVAVYALTSVHQVFHSVRSDEVRDAFDNDSVIAYYSFVDEKVKTSVHLSKKDRLETYPCFSPDGKHLYFCSAEKTWQGRPEQFSLKELESIKYDIIRLDFDVDTETFSNPQVIVSAEKTGKSSLQPRISPDGRFLIFTVCDYSAVPVLQPSSDLYMIDLTAQPQPDGTYASRRLDINSDLSESWHSFSKNSRWLAFSSKGYNGTFTRICLSYIGDDGVAGKPFLLPQKDPGYYDSCLRTFSVPELISGPVRTTREQLGKVVRRPSKTSLDMPVTMASPKSSGASKQKKGQYDERE
jgi:hypothetical protein